MPDRLSGCGCCGCVVLGETEHRPYQSRPVCMKSYHSDQIEVEGPPATWTVQTTESTSSDELKVRWVASVGAHGNDLLQTSKSIAVFRIGSSWDWTETVELLEVAFGFAGAEVLIKGFAITNVCPTAVAGYDTLDTALTEILFTTPAGSDRRQQDLMSMLSSFTTGSPTYVAILFEFAEPDPYAPDNIDSEITSPVLTVSEDAGLDASKVLRNPIPMDLYDTVGTTTAEGYPAGPSSANSLVEGEKIITKQTFPYKDWETIDIGWIKKEYFQETTDNEFLIEFFDSTDDPAVDSPIISLLLYSYRDPDYYTTSVDINPPYDTLYHYRRQFICEVSGANLYVSGLKLVLEEKTFLYQSPTQPGEEDEKAIQTLAGLGGLSLVMREVLFEIGTNKLFGGASTIWEQDTLESFTPRFPIMKDPDDYTKTFKIAFSVPNAGVDQRATLDRWSVYDIWHHGDCETTENNLACPYDPSCSIVANYAVQAWDVTAFSLSGADEAGNLLSIEPENIYNWIPPQPGVTTGDRKIWDHDGCLTTVQGSLYTAKDASMILTYQEQRRDMGYYRDVYVYQTFKGTVPPDLEIGDPCGPILNLGPTCGGMWCNSATILDFADLVWDYTDPWWDTQISGVVSATCPSGDPQGTVPGSYDTEVQYATYDGVPPEDPPFRITCENAYWCHQERLLSVPDDKNYDNTFDQMTTYIETIPGYGYDILEFPRVSDEYDVRKRIVDGPGEGMSLEFNGTIWEYRCQDYIPDVTDLLTMDEQRPISQLMYVGPTEDYWVNLTEDLDAIPSSYSGGPAYPAPFTSLTTESIEVSWQPEPLVLTPNLTMQFTINTTGTWQVDLFLPGDITPTTIYSASHTAGDVVDIDYDVTGAPGEYVNGTWYIQVFNTAYTGYPVINSYTLDFYDGGRPAKTAGYYRYYNGNQAQAETVVNGTPASDIYTVTDIVNVTTAHPKSSRAKIDVEGEVDGDCLMFPKVTDPVSAITAIPSSGASANTPYVFPTTTVDVTEPFGDWEMKINNSCFSLVDINSWSITFEAVGDIPDLEGPFGTPDAGYGSAWTECDEEIGVVVTLKLEYWVSTYYQEPEYLDSQQNGSYSYGTAMGGPDPGAYFPSYCGSNTEAGPEVYGWPFGPIPDPPSTLTCSPIPVPSDYYPGLAENDYFNAAVFCYGLVDVPMSNSFYTQDYTGGWTNYCCGTGTGVTFDYVNYSVKTLGTLWDGYLDADPNPYAHNPEYVSITWDVSTAYSCTFGDIGPLVGLTPGIWLHTWQPKFYPCWVDQNQPTVVSLGSEISFNTSTGEISNGPERYIYMIKSLAVAAGAAVNPWGCTIDPDSLTADGAVESFEMSYTHYKIDMSALSLTVGKKT